MGFRWYTDRRNIHMVKREARSSKPQAHRTPRGWFPRRWLRVAVLAVVLAACSFVLAVAPAVLALETGLQFGTATGLSTQDIRITVAKIIRAFIGILGLVALVIILYGGFLWMTSGGEEEKIAKGKKVLGNGVIGLVIILLSIGIVQFVISRLTSALYGQGQVTTAGGFVEDVFLTGALGAGPIESHYPGRGAGEIPRNTRIFVTFRHAIDPATIAADSNGNQKIGTACPGTPCDVTQYDNYQDLVLPEAVQVMRVGTNVDTTKLTVAGRTQDAAAFAAEAAKLTPVGLAVAPDGKTIILSPVVVRADGRVQTTASGFAERAFLGNADQPTAYIVRLTSAIKRATRRADGAPEDLFTGAFREYAWDFGVSTIIDLTPPQITSVVPFPDTPGTGRDTIAADGTVTVRGAPDQPRNVIVQVNFNEAVDPTVTTGTLTAEEIAAGATNVFRHLAVTRATTRTPGTFIISNQYRTVEFTTDSACGQNSCGGTVYCLPGNAELLALAEAAQLEAGGPAGLPFSGVMDAAGNSLDGNGNDTAQGPGVSRFDRGALPAANAGASDSVQWTFFTNDTIDLTAPEIREIAHYRKGADESRMVFGGTTELEAPVPNVSLTKPIEVLFSKLMSGSVGGGIRLSEEAGCNETTGAGCLWFTTYAAHEDSPPPGDSDDAIDATRATVSHAALRDVQAGFDVPEYRVRVDSSVKDIYQNCMFTLNVPAGPRGPRGGQSCVGPPGQEFAAGQRCGE